MSEICLVLRCAHLCVGYELMCVYIDVVFFFFKQKTAYEMRISDWSSDVCSSDLANRRPGAVIGRRELLAAGVAALTVPAVARAQYTRMPPGIAKSLNLLIRKPGAPHEEFMRYWPGEIGRANV